MPAMQVSMLLLLAAPAITLASRVAIKTSQFADGDTNETLIDSDTDEYNATPGAPGTWEFSWRTTDEIKDIYWQHRDAFRVWDLACGRLIIWNRGKEYDSVLLDCDLCQPLRFDCVYNKWETTLAAVGHPVHSMVAIKDGLSCRNSLKGFLHFCPWYCVPDDSRTKCKSFELPRNLLEEALEDSVAVQRHGAPQGADARLANVAPPILPRKAASNSTISSGDVVNLEGRSEEEFWVAQKKLPEGWLVRSVDGSEETVVPALQLILVPADHEVAIQVHAAQVAALKGCRTACLDEMEDLNKHDLCCWTYAGPLGNTFGSYISASCVAICTGHDARKKPPGTQVKVEEQLPSWVKLSAPSESGSQ